MKRVASILLAMVMVLSMAMTAFAAETHTITVPENGHTYEVYQIFKGELAGDTLSDVVWGANGTGTVDTKVEDAVLEELEELVAGNTDKVYQNELDVITKYVRLNSTPVATLGEGLEKSASVVAGYYLIKDKNNTVPEGDSYTTFVVKIVKDLKLQPKDETSGVVKKVKDKNDTTGAITNWQDSADYHIGDVMPFQLRGTVAGNYAEFDVYYFAFHDKEEKGLTFQPDSVVVYIDSNKNNALDEGEKVFEKNVDYELVLNPTDGHTFDIVFEDLTLFPEVTGGTQINVEYSSVLNKDAVIGSKGNKNTVYLEFSNNPSDEQGGEPHGKTPEDTVIIFTFETIVNKVDPEGKPLTGAEFTLSQKLADGTWKVIGVVMNDAGTTFTFKGLDDGFYKLEETKTPDGYNSIDTIYFEITATHDEEADLPKLNTLTVVQKNESAVDLESGKITFRPTVSPEDGIIITDIVNKPGTILPETGGMGTTLFYVFGTIFVVGAAVVLVTKKRMTGIK